MPSPIPNLISASLIICERVLNEKDDFLSAIRLADVIYINTSPSNPLASHPVVLHALFVAKLYEHDGAVYGIHFKIIDPKGAVEDTRHQDIQISSKGGISEDVPRGLMLGLELGIEKVMIGTYFIAAHLNGIEVIRAPFTIIERKPS